MDIIKSIDDEISELLSACEIFPLAVPRGTRYAVVEVKITWLDGYPSGDEATLGETSLGSAVIDCGIEA